jgi:uncharacterized protein YkwD
MRRPALARSAHGLLVALVIAIVAAMFLVAPRAHAGSLTASGYASRLLALVNQAREQHGLDPLQVATGTDAVAASWTQHLAAE